MATTQDRELAELAAAYGVATSYENWQKGQVRIDPDVIRAVLRLLDVDADNPGSVRRELAEVRARRAGDTLPPTVVVRPGQPWTGPARGGLIPGRPVDLPLG